MTDLTYPTRYTESDEELDETINFKAIEYNDRLIRGIEAFERRDYQTALEKYLQALDHIDENDFGRRALLKRYKKNIMSDLPILAILPWFISITMITRKR